MSSRFLRNTVGLLVGYYIFITYPKKLFLYFICAEFFLKFRMLFALEEMP
jgi:hypothetical protein